MNFCKKCDEFYPKELANYAVDGTARCHIYGCNNRLRTKPRSHTCREFYKENFI